MLSKKDLALNNQQWLICHKTIPNQTDDEPQCSETEAEREKFLVLFVFFV